MPLQNTDAHQLLGLELQWHTETCFVRAFKHVVNIHGKYVLHIQTNCTHIYMHAKAHSKHVPIQVCTHTYIPCTYKTHHPKNTTVISVCMQFSGKHTLVNMYLGNISGGIKNGLPTNRHNGRSMYNKMETLMHKQSLLQLCHKILFLH